MVEMTMEFSRREDVVLKVIDGFGGNYYITNDGVVISKDRMENSKSESKRLRKGGVLKQIESNCGYMRVGLRDGKRQKLLLIHRLVAIAYVDGFMDGLVVNHKDGDKKNNHKSNLEWVTPSNNNKHAYANGLAKSKKGSDSSRYGGDISCINIKTGDEFLIRGKSEINALGFTPQSVYSCLSGKLKTHAGHRFYRLTGKINGVGLVNNG